VLASNTLKKATYAHSSNTPSSVGCRKDKSPLYSTVELIATGTRAKVVKEYPKLEENDVNFALHLKPSGNGKEKRAI